MARRTGLVLALAALLCVAPAPAAPAAGLDATQTALQRQMRHAGAASGAYALDLSSSEELISWRADVARVPASVEKLYTTAAALMRLGPATELQTAAHALVAPGLDGVLAGDLYLRGGGDPTLGGDDIDALAQAVATTGGVSEVTGRVIGDETLFDGLRGPPSSRGRISAYVGPLSALAFNRGRTGRRRPYWEDRPAAAAARAFARALKRHGVNVSTSIRTGPTPEGALELGTIASPTLGELARLANTPSDNFVAEMLLKALGAREVGDGSTAAGAGVVSDALAGIGLRPKVVDGSGLSRGNRTTPRQVVALLAHLADEPVLYPDFRRSLAIAGRTGTLSPRLRRSAARDRCRGKTGTLISVSTVAGYCQTRGGRLIAFAILMNRVSPYYARKRQDRMIDAIARYG